MANHINFYFAHPINYREAVIIYLKIHIFGLKFHTMYGSKIASIRIARGYSQDYVAQKIGIKQNTLSDIEKDIRAKIDEKTLTAIADVLGVSIDDIKSPTPIIMNFTTNDTATAVGQQNNSTDTKIIDTLMAQIAKKDEQLAKKDEQIDKLLEKISK
ncbi:MAG: helix-turn-helix transcriptional regulator [Chitinophagaceae bacterium]|nr:helix-turn-helix transcriptional regulator [Chitinophagaceae bacterium]